MISDSKLPNHSNYYVEDEFYSYTKKLNTKFSVFQLNIRSLNYHHKEIVAYLQLLNFTLLDCICLTEVWKTSLNPYQSIFEDYMPFFC